MEKLILSKENLNEQIEISFKKLKGSVYFDKTQLILRDKIVEYESDGDIDEKIKNIENILLSSNSNKWDDFVESQLESIDYLVFPKKIKKCDSNIIFNTKKEAPCVDKVQYMFDSNVEVHIIGILWMLTIGIHLDSQLSDYVFGNRFRPNVINEFKNSTYSPNILKPYFTQYQTWRDNGLKIAEKYIDKKIDVLVATIDLKEFYYSVDFTEDNFNDFINRYGNIESNFNINIIKKLNNFTYKVIEKYSTMIKPRLEGENCLPIGFLPSSILANWYLHEFDTAIHSKLNPLYYGRYVDDIIIVDKIEKDSFFHKKIASSEVTSENLLTYLLCNCKANQDVSCKNENSILNKNTNKNSDKNTSEDLYHINKSLLLNKEGKTITVQKDKVKIFYFKSGGSKALLKSFRNAINKNSSEFRLIPGDDEYLSFGDYSNIYEIFKDKNSSINKFREISDVEINRFNLSKFLGKMTKISTLVNDEKENTFENDIIKIFDQETIVENYTFLETILQQLIANERFDLALEFIKNATNAFNQLKIDCNSKADKDLNTITVLKCSLFEHLISSIIRSCSLVWGKNVKSFLKEVNSFFKKTPSTKDYVTTYNLQHNNSLLCRNNYLATRMVNKFLIVGMIENVIDGNISFTDEEDINLSSFNSFFDNIKNKELMEYKYYPYIVKLQDIEMYEYIRTLKHHTEDKTFHNLKNCKKLYSELNYPNVKKDISFFNNIEEKKIVKEIILDSKIKSFATISNILQTPKNTISIAIANTVVKESDFKKVLTENPNRSVDRYNKLKKIVNCAIEEKANILIMPECYVPFEWLPLLAQKASQNKLAIITGVEHILVKNGNTSYITNLTATILPYLVDENIVSSHINLRNKVHYSPGEIREIQGYGYDFFEGNEYDLFCYNDFWFSVYCCFELASIHDRSIFSNIIDSIVAVEFNRDTEYFNNIIESLSRDLHCYCAQVNTSTYGDSRIISPSKSYEKNILQVKGGKNDTVLIGEIDIKGLREFQLKKFELQKDDKRFKPTPPSFDVQTVRDKINKKLFERLTQKT